MTRFKQFLAPLLVLLGVELVTGIILLPFYRPSAAQAHASTMRIGESPVLGIIRDLHHWISALLIVFLGALVLYGLVAAVYKQSSRKLWIGSVFLLLFVLVLQLTGHLLPWDQHAVRTTAIEAGIGSDVPVIGDLQGRLIRAGESVGPSTLTLWFWLHVGLFSLLALLVGVLLYRKAEASGKKALPFAGGLTLLGVILALVWPVRYGPPATPLDYGSFEAKPEWYTLPLHTLLRLFQSIDPKLAFLGTMVIPGIALLLVVLAPWIDRKQKSMYGPALAFILGLGTLVLGGMSIGKVALPAGPNVAAVSAPAPPSQVTVSADTIAKAKKLIDEEGCLDCHKLDGKGGKGGPSLNGTGARHPDVEWQLKHLIDPASLVSGSTMPDYKELGEEKLRPMAEYMTTLK